jgi:ribosomal protein S18 acetylase RimI-like enzyme
MTASDLSRVVDIAAAVHPAFPEHAAVFAERLRLCPQGCHVLEREGAIAGYVISHPWTDAPPALDTLLARLPDRPSTYYIHDLALLPAVRGNGAANAIVALLTDHARREKFATVSLVAVNNSERFWRKHGFDVVHDDALAGKLRSYGEDARRMRMSLL